MSQEILFLFLFPSPLSPVPPIGITMIDIASRFLDINNFQRAWEKVAEKRGCAGVDGETISLTYPNARESNPHKSDILARPDYPHSMLQKN